jgi:hypothetical protein
MVDLKLKSLMGSDRPGHLAAIVGVGGLVIITGTVIGSPWLMGVGGLAILWEWACTPDVDLVENRKPLKKLAMRCKKRGSFIVRLWRVVTGLLWCLICWLWWPYGYLVSHRSKFSHSLTVGLPCRLLYVLCVLWLLWPQAFDWAIADSIQLLLSSEAAMWLRAGFVHLWSMPLEATWAILKGFTLLPGDVWQFVASLGDRVFMLLVAAALGDFVHLSKGNYSLKEMISAY